MGKYRRIQLFFLAVYLGLLIAAIWFPIEGVELFLQLDPLIGLVTVVAGGTVAWTVIFPLMAVLLTGISGRVFCSHICPMGTTIDVLHRWCHGKKNRSIQNDQRLRRIKYGILGFVMGAAAIGISLVFVVSPLSWITRFYGLLIHSVLASVFDKTVEWLQPLANWLDWRGLMFFDFHPPRYASLLIILSFFFLMTLSGNFVPRFWCRYLCPSGALFAWISRLSPMKRHVNLKDCIQCGKCRQHCPMGAIPGENPGITWQSECIVCRTCETVCPKNAIIFSTTLPKNWDMATQTTEKDGTDLSSAMTRRQFVVSGISGLGTALVCRSDLKSVYTHRIDGQVRAPYLIRPPGSRPESEFLSLCVRCGECMAACPTNTLQPVLLDAGMVGLFSPAMVARRAYCDPRCHRCGQVCPTEAIRPLAKIQRIWAKTGTAVIHRQQCLAWEHQKSCMVCDEVCPFDAIQFKTQPQLPYPVPHVQENKCAGCGYCEHFCPVRPEAAIRVTPMGALRLSDGSYLLEAKYQGLDLKLKKTSQTYPVPDAPADSQTGNTPADTNQLAPGFDEGD